MTQYWNTLVTMNDLYTLIISSIYWCVFRGNYFFLGSYTEAGRYCCPGPQEVTHSTSKYVNLFMYARHRFYYFSNLKLYCLHRFTCLTGTKECTDVIWFLKCGNRCFLCIIHKCRILTVSFRNMWGYWF